MNISLWFCQVSDSTQKYSFPIENSVASKLDLKLREHMNISEMAKSRVYHENGEPIWQKPQNKNFFLTVFLIFFWELLGEKTEASGSLLRKYKRQNYRLFFKMFSKHYYTSRRLCTNFHEFLSIFSEFFKVRGSPSIPSKKTCWESYAWSWVNIRMVLKWLKIANNMSNHV